jgi:SAM-dependent methyltransferase
MASGDIHRYPPVNCGRDPYSSLSHLYDRIMEHVDYAAWLDLIQNILGRYLETRNPSVLEVGGGTGTMGRILLDSGIDYHGSDISFGMCAEARRKKVPFACADALRLPYKRLFDMIIFLYDGINYFPGPYQYTVFCREAAGCLTPGGLLLFDITTRTNSMKYFRNLIDFEDYGDSAYVRHSHFDSSSSLQFNDFTVFSKCSSGEELFKKHTGHHVQKVLSVKEILKAVPEELFTVDGVWDGFSFRRRSSRSTRIHFLLRKRENR